MVAEKQQAQEMEIFASRVISKYNGTIMDGGGLTGLAAYFGEHGSDTTYQNLFGALVVSDWIDGLQFAARQPLTAAGFKNVIETESEDQVRAFTRRMIVHHGGKILDEAQLFELAPSYLLAGDNHTGYLARLEQLHTDLKSASWIENYQSSPLRQATEAQLQAASSDCDTCEKGADLDQLLFIGVMSAPENAARRDEVRNSWMQDRIFQENNPKVATKFIVGQSANEDVRFQVEEETRQYGDIVMLPVEDSYSNLPNKSISFFRWFANKWCCTEPSQAHWYVMKLDDDSWPNLQLLLPYLDDKKINPSSLNYIGGLLWNGPVQREGKWAETASKEDFPLSQYPAYAAGSGYILSMDLARQLNDIIEERGITLLRNEDTTIGNFIYQEDHLTMAVNYYDLAFREYGCEEGSHVAMNLCPGEMACMWNKRLKGLGANKTGFEMCCNPPEEYGLPKEGCLPNQR